MPLEPTPTHPQDPPPPRRGALYGVLAALGLYAVSLALGAPQEATRLVAEAAPHAVAADSPAGHEDAGQEDGAPGADHEDAVTTVAPPLWAVAPFVLLLGAIAVLPLLGATEHWWESNLHRFQVAAGLGLVVLLYYGLMHEGPIDGHFPAHYVAAPQPGFNTDLVLTTLRNAVLGEFVPFIVLLFSLYTISGGIRIAGDLEATPLTNAAFLTVGAALASLIGTTGAAMLLIRPLLETNAERRYVVHTVVFFIFTVCNCGGCLLPIGDPPLFLGYLQGVPFFWTLSLWPAWLTCNMTLVVLYVLMDHFWFHPREEKRDIQRDETQIRRLRFSGLALNAPLLLGVVAAVALLDPSKPVPGTEWRPWMYLREAVQLGLVAVSLAAGSHELRRKNAFTYGAIVEVAALFSGIFICMQPALQILEQSGDYLAERFLRSPTHFYWATGALSSFLDNAPTYLVFFKTAQSGGAGPGFIQGVPLGDLIGVSLGSVFLGAMTYIGNGPNFMVKSIAEKSGVRMPSFFGYMGYSCCLLLPVLAAVAWVEFG